MSIFDLINTYDDAWKSIIMPPKQEYSIYDLGNVDITIQNQKVKRSDFRLRNKRGITIECSYYQYATKDPIPCIIYLHANGCCRLEALSYRDCVLSAKMNFFCFDFSACGKSEGIYSSIGWFEQDDLECVIEFLQNVGNVSKIGVWGRSMGAITSILYASRDPRISCLIMDSAFSDFEKLAKEFAKKKAYLPGFLTEGVLGILRKTIQKKANFDIEELKPVKYVGKLRVPGLFGAAKGDKFVSPEHTKELYDSYGGEKEFILFEGDHNSQRPFNWLTAASKFLKYHLLGERPKSTLERSKSTIEKVERKDSLSGNSIQEAIKHANSQNELKIISEESREDKLDPQNQSKMQNQAQLQKSKESQQAKEHKMNFSWLDRSLSTPCLVQDDIPCESQTKNQEPQNEKKEMPARWEDNQNKRVETINNEYLPNQPTISKPKVLNHKFQIMQTTNVQKSLDISDINNSKLNEEINDLLSQKFPRRDKSHKSTTQPPLLSINLAQVVNVKSDSAVSTLATNTTEPSHNMPNEVPASKPKVKIFEPKKGAHDEHHKHHKSQNQPIPFEDISVDYKMTSKSIQAQSLNHSFSITSTLNRSFQRGQTIQIDLLPSMFPDLNKLPPQKAQPQQQYTSKRNQSYGNLNVNLNGENTNGPFVSILSELNDPQVNQKLPISESIKMMPKDSGKINNIQPNLYYVNASLRSSKENLIFNQ